MTEDRAYVLELLRRQAEWQAAQARLTRAEKIRLAEAIRESIAILRLKPVSHRGQTPISRGSSGF